MLIFPSLSSMAVASSLPLTLSYPIKHTNDFYSHSINALLPRSATSCKFGVATGVSRVSFHHRVFSGLKMSSTEGLSKRIRDPQVLTKESSERVAKTRDYVRAQISKPGVKSLIVAVAIPFVLGSIDGLANSPASKWYADLKKPWWQPPSFLFGGTWSILYPLMGLASWLVWAEGGFQKHGQALGLYAAQLVLNLLWPVFFFRWKNLGLALADIVALAVVLVATIRAFAPANHVAANLLKPYLAWVLFATALNIQLYLSNKGDLTTELKTAE